MNEKGYFYKFSPLMTSSAITFPEIRKRAFWDTTAAGKKFCASCKAKALYNKNGHFVKSKYCPSCGAEMIDYQGWQNTVR